MLLLMTSRNFTFHIPTTLILYSQASVSNANLSLLLYYFADLYYNFCHVQLFIVLPLDLSHVNSVKGSFLKLSHYLKMWYKNSGTVENVREMITLCEQMV